MFVCCPDVDDSSHTCGWEAEQLTVRVCCDDGDDDDSWLDVSSIGYDDSMWYHDIDIYVDKDYPFDITFH